MSQKSIRLHLGCQEKYLKGYINIDLPPSAHTVEKVKADLYADVRDLKYEPGSIIEVRSHHLLEHFRRAESLILLSRWHKWLEPRGLLVVETPDFEESAKKFLASPTESQFVFARHIFGSQEADWAVHKDFWSESKFRYVLSRLGFGDFRFEKTSNNLERKIPLLKTLPLPKEKIADKFSRFGLNTLPNIICYALKTNSSVDYYQASKDILGQSLVGRERRSSLLNVWLKEIEGQI